MKSECVNNVSWWKQPALKLNLKARRAGGISHPLLPSSVPYGGCPYWTRLLRPTANDAQSCCGMKVVHLPAGRLVPQGRSRSPCRSPPPPTPTTKKKNHKEWAVLSCKSQGLVYSTCTDALNLPTLNVLTIHRWSRPAMYCERDTWPLIKIFNNCSSQNFTEIQSNIFF